MTWQRPLTGMERWHWLLDRAAPMNVVFIARIAGHFDRERLRDAIAVVAAHYPTLTARVEPDKRPYFVATALPIELPVVPWQPGAWRTAAVNEANTRIPAATGPLMRALLLDGTDTSDLLLSFNQTMGDGLTGARLIDELLTVYGGGARPALVSPEVLTPPLDGLLGSRFGALWATMREHRRARGLTCLEPVRATPAAQRRTALIDATFPAARTAIIARQARSHGASVHGALAAATLLAIGEQARGIDHARQDTIGCATPIDLRRRSGLSLEAVGNLFSRSVSAHRVHYDTLFWDLAGEVSKALRGSIASGEMLAYARVRDTMGIGVSDAAVAKRVARAERFNRAAVTVNNLGHLTFYERFGDVALERLRFLVSANADVGSSLVLSALTLADTTCLSFTFAEPLLPAEHAQRVVDGTLERLNDVAR